MAIAPDSPHFRPSSNQIHEVRSLLHRQIAPPITLNTIEKMRCLHKLLPINRVHAPLSNRHRSVLAGATPSFLTVTHRGSKHWIWHDKANVRQFSQSTPKLSKSADRPLNRPLKSPSSRNDNPSIQPPLNSRRLSKLPTRTLSLILWIPLLGILGLAVTEGSIKYLEKRRTALEEDEAVNQLRKLTSQETLYSPLESNEFRVLLLEPGVGNEPVECNLSVCSHSDNLPYKALSYTWGDPTKTRQIQCNGKTMGVGSNLHEALLGLRDPSRVRILWIDALCINQDDVIERNHQVRKMRTIYAEAREVLVWLGQEDDHARQALAALKSFRFTWFGLRYPRSTSDEEAVGFDFSKTDDQKHFKAADLASLTKFLERPWFRRLWILQEVTHGKRVTLVLGKRAIDWEYFARPMRHFYHSGLVLELFSREAQAAGLAVVQMENTRRLSASGQRQSLLSTLLATQAGECSDIRDRIYAILSLAGDYDLDQDGDLHPDYHLSSREVFQKFARWSIAKGNLDILSCTTRSEKPPIQGLEDLPSWVPDWTRIDNAEPFVRYLSQRPAQADYGLQDVVPFRPRIRDKRELLVEGVQVDVIKAVGPVSTFKRSEIWKSQPKDIAGALECNGKWLFDSMKLAPPIDNGSVSLDKSKNSFWRTMTANMAGDGFRAEEDRGLWFQDYLNLLKEVQEAEFSSAGDSSSLALITYDEKRRQQSAAVESAILMWASKRRFAVTEDGNAAMVPNNTRPGDLVVILRGAKVPHVFRKISDAENGKYMVLGETYVDVYMDGRLLASQLEELGRRALTRIRSFTLV